jgi:phage gp46-like protein
MPQAPTTSDFTDFDIVQGADGVYDLAVDTSARDVAVTHSLYTAVFISLFSDRRARADEVADPMMRRGWIGDLVSDVPGDLHGSGLWFYRQSRLAPQVSAGVEAEARNALQWMIQQRICNSVTAKVVRDDATRTITLSIVLGLVTGDMADLSFVLATANHSGLLTTT